MATDYQDTPSFFDRIVGADLVISGRVGRLVQTEPSGWGDDSRIYGLFEVVVDDVLMGEPPSDGLILRVLGERNARTAEWVVPLGEDTPSLMVLVRDVEPTARTNLYAPVFSGVYPLRDRYHVEFPEEALDERTREEAGVEGHRVSLDGVRRLIESILRERMDRMQQPEETLPATLRDRPYPPVQEMPQQVEMGARPGTLERRADG